MKNNNVLYKSDLEFFNILVIAIFTIYVNYLFLKEECFKANIIFTTIMLVFIFFPLFRRVFFFDNYIKITYPLNIIKGQIVEYENIIKIYSSTGRGNVIVILYRKANKNKKLTFTRPSIDDYKTFRKIMKQKGFTIGSGAD